MSDRIRLLAGWLGVLATLIGAIALLGWVFGNDLLKGAFAQGITMKTNAAVCLSLSGLALALLSFGRPGPPRLVVARILAVTVVAIGFLTLTQHLFGWNLGIDGLFFQEPMGAAATQSPNRMGPPASMSFTLLGLALASLTAGQRAGNAHEKLALVALLISSVSILGYLFGVQELYGIGAYTGIAFVTGLSLFILGVGILCVRPDTGIARRLQERDSGALLTRRLLPAAILLPIVLMLLRLAGQNAGLYDVELGRAFLTLGFIVVFTVLIWQTGLTVSRQEDAASRSEADLQRRLIETLQALREADRRKDDFLAILAHELRNPLAPVRNAARLLSLRKSTDPEIEWLRSVIDRQVNHLTRLIDDLLDVSRLTRGRLQLRRSPLYLSDVIEAAVESIEPIAKVSGHRFAVNVPEEPIVIDGDSVRLTQIFTNLLSNAFKYTPPGGRIRLSAERLEHDVVVRVTDDGEGIGPEHLPHLFEMFYRKENLAFAMAQGGLGIGLALVRHLVELHGGSVDARSDGPGKGSEFTVRLPLAAEGVVVSPEEEDGIDPRIAGRRVLVVDDNKDAADSLAVLLAHAGAWVFTAEDGEQALGIAARSRPDIVLLDIGLPKLSGYDVARAIREDLGSNAVLIAVTGWGQEGDRERSKQAGFDHHLIKPVNPDALLRLVRDLDGTTSGNADAASGSAPLPL